MTTAIGICTAIILGGLLLWAFREPDNDNWGARISPKHNEENN